MKRVIVSIIGILIFLSSCANSTVTDPIVTDPMVTNPTVIGPTATDPTVTDTVAPEMDNDISCNEIQQDEPKENITLAFSSVEEMVQTFSTIQNTNPENITDFDTVELSALQYVAEQEIVRNGLPIPMYGGFELPLRNVNNLDNILIETYSAFDMPIIWYYAKLDGSNVIISTGILSSNQRKQIGDGGVVAWKDMKEELLAALPDDPNADEVTITTNLEQISIGEESILSSITKYSTDPRYHVEFILDDMLYVEIYIYPEDFDRGILKDLSFDVMTAQ